MQIYEIIILAIGLSMDAFAVSICKGLSLGKIKPSHCVKAGLWFGGFQGLMPLIGFLLAGIFAGFIDQYDHWVAFALLFLIGANFALLFLIGANMIREVFSKDEDKQDAAMDIKTMLLLAIATSIDALAIGVTFAFLDVNIILSVLIIGVTTFIFSVAGIKVGSLFGTKYKSKAELAGGIILILIGAKILLEGLGIIG